ncbi:hypothetical protein EON80_12945 [bacterium]|nr:MAG: hypothetical protein EON80_12945 [bacterium]
MSIRKIQFLPTLIMAGLSLSLAYGPVRADETKDSAKPANTQGGLLPGETRGQKRERLLAGIEEQVGTLAPDQRTHILAILAAAGDEMAAARNNTSLTAEQQGAVVRRVHGDVFNRISVALTEAQQAKLKGSYASGNTAGNSTLEERRERALKRYEKLTDLTVKQKSELLELTEASYKEMEAVNGNAALTSEQKREAVRKVHTATSTKVEAVLTKSQREQWQKIQAESRSQRGGRGATAATVAARN